MREQVVMCETDGEHHGLARHLHMVTLPNGGTTATDIDIMTIDDADHARLAELLGDVMSGAALGIPP